MKDHHLFFLYGQKVKIKEEGNKREVVMNFCQSNFSFLEFVTDSFKISKRVFLYHMRNVRKSKNNAVLLRMRDYKESFKVYFMTETDQIKAVEIFDKVFSDLKAVPYAEFSVKNLVRQVMYFSDIATFDSSYKIDSIENLLFHLRIKMEWDDLNKLFRRSVQNVEKVTKYDFRRIFKILLLKEELKDIFKKIANLGQFDQIKKKKIGIDMLTSWIQENQGESVKRQELNDFFEQIRSPNIFSIQKQNVEEIDFEEFCMYILSPLNDAFDVEKQKMYQDTSRPINNYYISASFNTYLIGHQQYGKPMIEGYERAIENGCRFVEIDCWDGPNNEPVVTHATTFTNDLFFKDLVVVLDEIAFKYSDMPLILNLEMNCSLPQRDRLAQILIDVLSDKIFLMSKSNFDNEELFTLDEVKNKILIKCRCVYPNYVLSKKEQNKVKPELLSTITTFYEEKYNEGGLRTIFGFSSLNEGKINVISQNLLVMNRSIEFHQKYMNYCFPDVHRIDSSNYNPVTAWNLGIHAVALNIQKMDNYTLLNIAKFKENGNSGFLLKPDYLINKELRIYEDEKIFTTCKIKIISSQIIKKSFHRSDYFYPFVQIRIEGMEKDILFNKKLSTKIFQNNLFHSVYLEENSQPFEIKLFHPELAFVKFIVRDAQTNEIIKHNAVPFNCLRKGFRNLPLLDHCNTHDSFSYLLLDIDI